MKTTVERPHLQKEGCQDAADLRMAGCRLNWPLGNQVHIPQHRSQQRRKHSAKLSFRLQRVLTSPAVEPGHVPFPSGHILRGRRINRSDPGRPAVPTPSSGSVSGRSRRQFYPAVPAPSTHPHHRGPPDRQPTSARPSRQQSSLTPQAGAARPRKESRALDRPHASPISAHPPAVQTDSCPF